MEICNNNKWNNIKESKYSCFVNAKNKLYVGVSNKCLVGRYLRNDYRGDTIEFRKNDIVKATVYKI